jgi:hypothetical protein
MAALARVRCAGLPVHVEESRFEDAGAGGVPLVFSAQAWHWIDPAARCDVAAGLLRRGGTLALFWTVDQLADAAARAAVDEAYAAIAPIAGWSADLADETDPTARWPAAELVAHPAFTDVSAQLFRWERALPADDFLAYLATHSPVLRLDDGTRARLLHAVRRTLPDDVRLAEETTLYLASRG